MVSYSYLDSAIFIVFIWICGLVALTMMLRERKLARNGTAVLGVVRNCISKNRMFWVEYEFRPEEGVLISGDGVSADQYETGTSICILYLAENHHRNNLYPLSNYRVVD